MRKIFAATGIADDLGEVREAARIVPKALASLTAWSVMFKTVSAIALVPLLTWWMNWSVSLSGNAAVSNYELTRLATHPIGVVSIYLAIVVTLGLALFEQSGMLIIADAAKQNRRLKMPSIIQRAVSRWTTVLKLVALGLVAGTVIALPFAAIALVIKTTFWGAQDINYYLIEKPPEFYRLVACAAVLIAAFACVMIFLVLRTFYCLPACVLGGMTVRESIKWSWQASRARMKPIVRVFVAWFVCQSVLVAIVGLLLQLFEKMAFGLAGEKLAAVSIAVALILAINLVAGIVLSFLSVTTSVMLIFRLYDQAGGPTGEPFAESDFVVYGNDESVGNPEAPVPWYSRRVVIGAVLAVVGFLSIGSSYVIVVDAVEEQTLAVTAHRGDVMRGPENSLSAIDFAIDLECDFVEIDVQETKDGVVVLCHDKDFKRIANEPRNVWDMSLEEVKALDIGQRFSSDFVGERVPTLQEVIDLTNGKIKLNIELKPTPEQPQLVSRVVSLIQANQFHDQCIVSSLNTDALAEVRSLDENIRLCENISIAVGDITKSNVDAFSINSSRLDRATIERLQSRGFEVHVWTVNDAETMIRFVELGVDNMLTDDPALLLKILKEREDLEPVQRVLLRFRAWLDDGF